MVFRVTLFVMAMLFVIGQFAVSQDIVNLLINPDFDDGTNGWSLSKINGKNELIIVEDENGPFPGSGPYLWAKVDEVGDASWKPEIHSPSFNVKQGKVYTMAFWAKTEEGKTRSLSIKFEQLDTWVGPSQQINVTDQWTEFHFSPNMTMSSPPQVVVHIGFNMQKEDVWFDHFRVYQGEYIEEDLPTQPSLAVQPAGKLATTWARLRTR